MCLRLCCDPHKLTYISAIVTACEAVFFGALNLTLILLSTCVIKPPDEPLGAGLGDFYSFYFFSNESCYNRYGQNFTIPTWIDYDYPVSPRPNETNVAANLGYQIAYLSLHVAWILSCLILLYGNARKRWGFYIPWLLIVGTITIMDVTIAAFFIIDMTTVREDPTFYEIRPMIWGFCMYLRIFLFWFINLGHMATVLNAFCKTRHKRSKQERQRKKQEKKHHRELAEAQAKAAAEARAEAAIVATAAEAARVSAAAEANAAIANAAGAMATVLHTAQQYPETTDRPGVQNRAYDDYPGDPPPYTPPYHAPAPVPKEVRPFSYLNPSFRPNDSHDVNGMRANPAPNVAGAMATPKGDGYFSAIPRADYDEDYQDPSTSKAPLPHVKVSPGRSSNSFRGIPREEKPDHETQNKSGYYF